MTRQTIVATAVGLIVALCAHVAYAGDWRELARGDGYSIGYNAQGMVRDGDVLTVELVTALLPERQLPLYGISDLIINCETRDVRMGPFSSAMPMPVSSENRLTKNPWASSVTMRT